MLRVYQIYIHDTFAYIGVIADETIRKTTIKSISPDIYRVYSGYI